MISVRQFRENMKKYFELSSTEDVEINRLGTVYTLSIKKCTQSNEVGTKEEDKCTQSKEDRLSIARKALEDMKYKKEEVKEVKIVCKTCRSKEVFKTKIMFGQTFGMCKECYETEVLV